MLTRCARISRKHGCLVSPKRVFIDHQTQLGDTQNISPLLKKHSLSLQIAPMMYAELASHVIRTTEKQIELRMFRHLSGAYKEKFSLDTSCIFINRTSVGRPEHEVSSENFSLHAPERWRNMRSSICFSVVLTTWEASYAYMIGAILNLSSVS